MAWTGERPTARPRPALVAALCGLALAACAGGARDAPAPSQRAGFDPASPHNATAQRIFARIRAESREDE